MARAIAAMCHHNLFLRSGLREEHDAAPIRHAEQAIVHGRDDALTLKFAGFSLATDAHDRRRAGSAAFEAALAVGPSPAITYILGGVARGWAETRNGYYPGARSAAAQPVRPLAFAVHHALALGHLVEGRPEEAAAYQGIHVNPRRSISY